MTTELCIGEWMFTWADTGIKWSVLLLVHICSVRFEEYNKLKAFEVKRYVKITAWKHFLLEISQTKWTWEKALFGCLKSVKWMLVQIIGSCGHIVFRLANYTLNWKSQKPERVSASSRWKKGTWVMMDDASDVTASRTQKTSRTTSNKSVHLSCSMCATQVADKTQITIQGEIHNDVTSRKRLEKKKEGLAPFLGLAGSLLASAETLQ